MAVRKRLPTLRMPFVKVRAFSKCDFVAYHGTYEQRANQIEANGLKPGPRGAVWIAGSAKAAWKHTAQRAAMDGCPNTPITVLRVRVTGDAKSCPVFRPVRPVGQNFLATTQTIPPDQILGRMPVDQAAVRAGHRQAAKQLTKRKKARPASCPPPSPIAGPWRRW